MKILFSPPPEKNRDKEPSIMKIFIEVYRVFKECLKVAVVTASRQLTIYVTS